MAKGKIFLDSSVLLAAALSYKGGSFYILNKLRGKFVFLINEYVFEEIIKVLDGKFPGRDDLKNKVFLFIGITPIKITPDPSKKEVQNLEKIINKKDIPILASAIKHSDYFITLDNDFLAEEVIKFSRQKGLSILKPRGFIAKFKGAD